MSEATSITGIVPFSYNEIIGKNIRQSTTRKVTARTATSEEQCRMLRLLNKNNACKNNEPLMY